MSAPAFNPDALDALLADHDTLANIDAVIAVIRSHGREPCSAVIYEHAAYNELAPAEAEALVALIRRRRSSQEASS